MSVDTIAILTKGTTIEQIENALSKKYKDVKVRAVFFDHMSVNLRDGIDIRTIWVSFTGSPERDYGIAGVGVSLSCWGSSVEICEYLCETFGGYLKENSGSDEGFYAINYDLYCQGKDFTAEDEFRHKVINEIGYDKVKIAMKLLNEYAYLKSTKD